jgi:hypothetical protein
VPDEDDDDGETPGTNSVPSTPNSSPQASPQLVDRDILPPAKKKKKAVGRVATGVDFWSQVDLWLAARRSQLGEKGSEASWQR